MRGRGGRVVGGGNSAGQAAVFLSQIAAHVQVLVRGPGLSESMSRYLIQRIESSPNVTLRTRTEIEALDGADRPRAIRVRQLDTGACETRSIRHVFVMTGADPEHRLAPRAVSRLDEKGFVKTGADLLPRILPRRAGACPRAPYLLETSKPGRVRGRRRARGARQARGRRRR